MAFATVNIEMTGSEIPYKVPHNVKKIIFKAYGAALRFAFTTGATGFHVEDKGSISIDNSNIANTTVFLTQISGTVDVMYTTDED